MADAPEKEEPKKQSTPGDTAEAGKPKSWWEGVVGAAPTFVTALGAVAAALVARQVSSDLGKGADLTHNETIWWYGSLVGLGAALGVIISLPFLVRLGTRVSLQQVTKKQAGTEAFGGFAGGSELADRIKTLHDEYRGYLSGGFQPPAALLAEIGFLHNARDSSLQSGRNAQARKWGTIAAAVLPFAAAMVIVSYAKVTAITNDAVERQDEEHREELIDEEQAHRESLLADKSSERGAPGFFDSSTPIVFRRPKATACFSQSRKGFAVDFTHGPHGHPDQVVKVLLTRTKGEEACPAVMLWASADELLIPPSEPPDEPAG